jgi:hypothetical protein
MSHRRAILAATLGLVVMLPFSAQADDVLSGWTRIGSVYQRIDLDGGTTRTCASICNGDPQCQAWVWTMPGLEGPDAGCSLLAASETPRPAPGRVTGLSEHIADWYDASAERPPSDREIEALLAAQATRME